jgi:ubiquinone/menaquinone biosynthesis C-methylase UbiE
MPDGQWQLAGSAPEAYERYLVPAIFAPWGERLVAAAGVGPGDRVVDVGCGTGVVARLAAARVGPGGAVAGADLNRGMIAVAARLAPGIAFEATDAGSLPYPDDAFDAALCQFAVMFFPDRAAALAELRRVLAPGGRLALSAWRGLDHNPGWAALVAALDAQAGPAAADLMRAPFSYGDPGALRTLVERAGFSGVRVEVDAGTIRFPSAAELLRRQFASFPPSVHTGSLPDAAWAALVADLAERMRPYTGPDGIAFPAAAHVVTARA